MKVEAIKEHSNPFGRGRGKHVGDQFTMPADEVQAYVEAGLVKKVEAKK